MTAVISPFHFFSCPPSKTPGARYTLYYPSLPPSALEPPVRPPASFPELCSFPSSCPPFLPHALVSAFSSLRAAAASVRAPPALVSLRGGDQSVHFSPPFLRVPRSVFSPNHPTPSARPSLFPPAGWLFFPRRGAGMTLPFSFCRLPKNDNLVFQRSHQFPPPAVTDLFPISPLSRCWIGLVLNANNPQVPHPPPLRPCAPHDSLTSLGALFFSDFFLVQVRVSARHLRRRQIYHCAFAIFFSFCLSQTSVFPFSSRSFFPGKPP